MFNIGRELVYTLFGELGDAGACAIFTYIRRARSYNLQTYLFTFYDFILILIYIISLSYHRPYLLTVAGCILKRKINCILNYYRFSKELVTTRLLCMLRNVPLVNR